VLYVAFNPFFPDPAEREAERGRLRAKLATGLVTGGVALQFGDDAGLLEEGLQFLRRPGVLGPRGRVLGSVFVPTKRFLAQMRFRPWAGVFLGDDYLGSVEGAREKTGGLLRVYRKYGVLPLVETSVADEGALESAEALLRRAGG
jgi:hypothetical protein